MIMMVLPEIMVTYDDDNHTDDDDDDDDGVRGGQCLKWWGWSNDYIQL